MMKRKYNECLKPLALSELTKYAKKHTDIVLSYNEIYGFIARYSLVTSKGDAKMVCLSALQSCRKVIQENYDISQHYSVAQSLVKIDNWINIAKAYLSHLEENEKKQKNIGNLDFEISIYDYVEINPETGKNGIYSTVSFKEVYQEYKDMYFIPDNEPGCVKQFKDYLNITMRRIDPEDFMKVMVLAGQDL